MGSNYGWSLVQCVADLASLPAFGTATAFWPQSLASRGTWDEASYRENRSNDPSSMSSVVPRGPRCGLFTVLPICWQIIAGQWA